MIQDVHGNGERAAVFADDWDPSLFDAKQVLLSEWEPIPHLAHLQLLYSDTPYWGRSLRYFNEHPWWYRKSFEIVNPIHSGTGARLVFTNADYFARVWLNGTFLGSHEGYATPFSFEVGALLHTGANTVVVEASSPWDAPPPEGWGALRFARVERNMIKGTYEHGDTFVQRDVNPIGLFGQVRLDFHPGLSVASNPLVTVDVHDDGASAVVSTEIEIDALESQSQCVVELRVRDLTTGGGVGLSTETIDIPAGSTKVTPTVGLADPKLWYSWDRGPQPLYLATVTIRSQGADESPLAEVAQRFGIRTVELIRGDKQMVYRINGEKIFLRGTCYFPEVYLSKMSPQRYLRDLSAIRESGCNAVRVHVHVANSAFYEICDELGLLVIQDSDLNWSHVKTDEFRDRAVQVFREMVVLLRNHPSIISWVGINEPSGGKDGDLFAVLGPALREAAREIDPNRPIILGSGARGDQESGDSHNYAGSLDGHDTSYLTLHDSDERLNTEFGFDAPACIESLRQEPVLLERLSGIADKIPALQHYQYRLLKYGIESYRIKKYAPCGGYFQFMWIDLCPQSFYGVFDYWGVPKEGHQAIQESAPPLGIFLEHTDQPIALWVVNDTNKDLGQCQLVWSMADRGGDVVAEGTEPGSVGPDSCIRVAPVTRKVDLAVKYIVDLRLLAEDGTELAHNHYEDPFHHPPHPEGHPHRVSNELGMRLYDA